MFKAETYVNRRKKLTEKLGSGLVLLLGNEESSMNYSDNTFPFRQDSSFLYFFGINFPGLAAIIDIDNQKEIIFGDDYTIDNIVWMGAQPTIADRVIKTGVSMVLPADKLGSVISAAVDSKREVHFLPPYRPENKIRLAELLPFIIEELSLKASLPLIKAVVGLREIKSDEEIVELNKAVDLSVDMHVAAMKFARPGMLESEVAAKVHEVAHAANGDISFPIIATINGQTLHNHYHGNVIKSGDLFLLDAGASTEMMYAGDLSSTFPVDSQFSTKQKEIYQASLNAHEAAISSIAPGVEFKEVHFAACRSIYNSMKEMGFAKGDTEEALAEGAHALFFPCGTGHMMGLDVHDMEDLGEVWVGYDGIPKSTQFGLKSLRLAKTLQPGHVFTIEPGIYFIPELIDLWRSQKKFSQFINWDKVNEYRNFGGVRNEEDFVVTKTGFKRLGKGKPKTLTEVEIMRNS